MRMGFDVFISSSSSSPDYSGTSSSCAEPQMESCENCIVKFMDSFEGAAECDIPRRRSCQVIRAPLRGADDTERITPGVAALHPGLISCQPFGLGFARQRRARTVARGKRAIASHPGSGAISKNRTPIGVRGAQ